MKKFLSIVCCLMLLAMALAACTPEEVHEHTFEDQLTWDSEYHWYPATCEHADEVKDKEAHTDEDGNAMCDVCSFVMNHTHTFETQWAHDANKHWHKATCGHQVKDAEAEHADANNDGVCDVCAYDYDHEHTYENKLTLTEGGHWYAPSCGHDIPGKDLADHADADNNGECDGCGYDYDHEHTYADTWNSDDSDHWKDVTCGHTIPVAEKGKHVDENADGKCDVCERVVDHFHTFDETTWVSDASGHWYAATCEHAEQRKNEAPHDGFEMDGICDTCGYVVFKVFNVTLNNVPEYVQILDSNGELLSNVIAVQEGKELVFQLIIPDYAKFEGVAGANVSEPIEDGENMIYTVSVTVNADIELNPVINKLTGYDKITEGSAVIETEGYKAGNVNISFQAPAPGTYAIYSLTKEDVQFGAVDSRQQTKVYVFTVDAAGEFTVRARCYGSGNLTVQHEFEYIIIKLEDQLTLPSLEGEGYFLPTMVPIDVYVTLPKAGVYQLTTSWDNLTWNDDLTKPYFITTTKDNQTVKLVARFDIFNYPVNITEFNLDWSIQLIAPEKEIKEGTNQITVPYGKQYGVSFTAPKTGSYVISNDSEYVRISTLNMREGVPYFDIQGKSYTVSLKAGETVALYMSIDIYKLPDGAGKDDIADKIKVEYTGYVPEYNTDKGGYEAAVDVPNTFVVSTAGDYKIVLPAGASISFDNGKTWSDAASQLKTFEAGQSLVYLVRSDKGEQIVIVDFQYQSYTFELDAIAGSNTVSLFPGKEYTVTLTGSIYNGMDGTSYILNWTENNITVTYGKEVFTAGPVMINEYTRRSVLVIVYNGAAEKEITFELTDNYDDHEHTYSNKLSFDEAGHWYAATCEHDTLKKDYDTHTLDANFACVCGFKHEHTYETVLSHDENGHWYAATCEHADQKKDYAAHSYDSKGLCVCGIEHVHTYETKWSKDENKHWIASDCNHGVANKDEAAHDYDAKGICKVCKFEHIHTYESTWTNDSNSHWHAVSCGHDTDVADFGAHNDSNKDGKCDTCELVVAHYHTFDTSKWMSDEEYHWYASTCGHDDVVDAKAAHEYDAKGICKSCKVEHKHTYESQWSKDENKHWHASDCGHGAANKDEAKHNYDAKGVCKDCGYEHIHTFATTWSKDETNHWYAVSCGHEVEVEKFAHEFDESGVCTACAYEHEHTYQTEWKYDGENHWREPSCGHKVDNKDFGAHTLNNKGVCTSCGWEHNHQYESDYVKIDSKNHGRRPICGCDIEPYGLAPHADETNDGICEECGWDYDHKHSYNTVYTTDEYGHWLTAACGHTIPITGDGEHEDNNVDGKCDVCGYNVGFNDPILNMLNGEFAANMSGLDLYKITFKPASENAPNGTMIVIDQLTGTANGTFNYVYDPATVKTTGLKLTDSNGKAFTEFTITASENDELVLNSGMVGSITMTQLSGGANTMKKVWEDSVEVTVEDSISTTETLTFTAPFTGSFVLRPSAGTKDVIMYDHWGALVSLPYQFSAKEGETVSFALATEIRTAGTYKVKVNVRGAEGTFVPSADRLLLDTNSVVVTHASEGGNAMYFRPSEAGTYRFTVVDGQGCLFSYNREGAVREYGDVYEVDIGANNYFDLRICVDPARYPDGSPNFNEFPNGGTVSDPVTVIVLIEKVG